MSIGILKFTSFCSLILLLIVVSTEASFEDFRCKCVCSLPKNTTARSVYIGGKDIEHNQCKCKYVIKPQTPDFCNSCECKYDRRNTTTIKVVVVFIICVVALLLVYMLFLLCLDPLIAWRPAHYAEHTNEEVNMVTILGWWQLFLNKTY